MRKTRAALVPLVCSCAYPHQERVNFTYSEVINIKFVFLSEVIILLLILVSIYDININSDV